MANTHHINFKAGLTYSFVITYTDPDGDPVDVTGGTFECKVREDSTASSALLLDLASSFAVTDGPAGQITCTILPATTSSFETEGLSGVYEAVLVLGADKFELVSESTFDAESRISA